VASDYLEVSARVHAPTVLATHWVRLYANPQKGHDMATRAIADRRFPLAYPRPQRWGSKKSPSHFHPGIGSRRTARGEASLAIDDSEARLVNWLHWSALKISG
jgi:hypothetical protein